MPIVINFWATWCKPCKKELNNIAEVYDEWQDETGVKIIAISIDDTRSMSKVAPYVNSVSWEYEVYLDPNGDLKEPWEFQLFLILFYSIVKKKSFGNIEAMLMEMKMNYLMKYKT